MKEIPILFSAPMVQAILEGRKTQTRRIVKFPRSFDWSLDLENGPVHAQITLDRMQSGYKEGVRPVFEIDEDADTAFSIKCRYGQPGDLLWVRETWCNAIDEPVPYLYRATTPNAINPDDDGSPWKPSIHMPKAAARIWLEVVSVRVERLQDISEKDAIAEGIFQENIHKSSEHNYLLWRYSAKSDWYSHPTNCFKGLWESINGTESLQANPWVWVVEFKKTLKPFTI